MARPGKHPKGWSRRLESPFDSHDYHFFVSQNHSQSSFELIDDGHNLELPPLGTRMQEGHHQDDMKHPLRSGNSQSLNLNPFIRYEGACILGGPKIASGSFADFGGSIFSES